MMKKLFGGTSLMFILISFATYANVTSTESNSQELFKDALELNLTKLLGPFPALGSVEENQDFKVLMDYQNSRTKAQCDEAALESKANLQSFFAGPKGPLTVNEIEKVKKHFRAPFLKAGVDITLSKYIYKRPRPYLTHPELVPCISLEKSKAYPSGHAALSRMYAKILGHLYPERKAEIMNRAEEVAQNRVIGGVHHPSDIVAGKKLGDALANIFVKSNEFKSSLQSFQSSAE
jgi:acid phosphatase (class A)